MIPESRYPDSYSSLSVSDTPLFYSVRRPGVKTVKNKAIILLHAVRSNGQDIFTLTRYLPDDLFVIAPKGPFTLTAGSHAWYDVDFSSGRPVINAKQEAYSRQRIMDFIQQVKKKFALDEIYLCGFSQGAVLTYTVGLTRPEVFEGIIGLSGRIPNEIKPLIQPGIALSRLKVFLAHGTEDLTLGLSYAKEAREYLEELQVKLFYHKFPMGHELHHAELRELNRFLMI